MQRLLRTCALGALVLFALGARQATAADSPAVASWFSPATDNPFDRQVAVGVYAAGWGGSYGAGGVGARIRWEPFRWLGADFFGEGFLVETPHGIRHDHPIGFNLYVPIRLGDAGRWRVRPMLGLCVVASFIEPTEKGAPRSDDVLFGPHGGVGVERALGRHMSLFAEAQGMVWFGHDRTLQGWTGAVGKT